MIPIIEEEDLSNRLIPPHPPVFYLFNKKRTYHRIMGRQMVKELLYYLQKNGKCIFDKYDVYQIETKEEYDKLRCMRELVS